ncbi:MAG: hypothetical protein PVF70_10775 [Anaerolineales bacterium]
MMPKPRPTLSDEYVQDAKCAICGVSSLTVVHLDAFPDYVSCDHCGSAFVVADDGSRVMYGNIASDYPDTQRFALREWATLESVRSYALHERPLPGADELPSQPSAPLPHEPAETPEAREEPLPESLPILIPTEPASPDAPRTPMTESDEPFVAQETPAEPETAAPDPLIPKPPKEEPPPVPEEEQVQTPPGPSPERRFFVAIKGDQINFPQGICAHCLSSPVRGVFEVPGRLPGEDPAGEARESIFQIPLCPECGRLASASSSGRKDSLLVAHLISLVAALLLIVGGILLGWANFSSDLTRGILVLGGLGLVGYVLPLVLLLPRARRHPLHQEIALVRSTLHVSQDPGNRQATIFAWRNQDYARQFLEANQSNAAGQVTSE